MCYKAKQYLLLENMLASILTYFHSKSQSTDDQDIGSGHTPHGLPAVYSELSTVQIFINDEAITSLADTVRCATILHPELLGLRVLTSL